MEAPDRKLRTYGNFRKPVSPGIGKFGLIGTALMFASLIVGVLAMALVGPLAGGVVLLVFGVALLSLVFRDRHGRTALQRVTTRIAWRRTKSKGAHIYRSGPLGRTPWGTFQLPGIAARTELSEARDSYSRPFALLHLPTTGDYTVVIASEPDGSQLVDQEQVDLWVAHWGEWLSALGDEPGVVAASATIETAPDTGIRLQREVHANIDPDAPELARNMLHEVVETYPRGSATVRSWVALTFNARAGGAKRLDAEQMGHNLASRLPGITQRLHATGAGAARPLSAQELCEVVHIAYEPAAARIIDDAYTAGTVPEMDWRDVGPAAAEARWDSYRHDGATSVTWSMTQAPRGAVQSSVLEQLLAAHRDVDRKRVTLLFRPMSSGVAADTVESDKRNADFKVSSSDRPTARALRDQAAANQAATAEASGHGLVNFGLLVTATTLRADGLEELKEAVNNLASTARIKLRPVYGSQDTAFVAALPLGLVLSKHLKVPNAIREAM